MIFETIHLTHDNSIDLSFVIDGVVAELSNTTRMTVEFGDDIVDSDTSPDAFDWLEGDIGKVYLSFGDESINVGSYNALVTIYDAVNVDGVVWGSFRCRVE